MIEFTQGICQDGAAILADGHLMTIEEVLSTLRLCDKLSILIECKACKGAGGGLGESLGFYECSDCGGDGQRIYGMEGTSLREILER